MVGQNPEVANGNGRAKHGEAKWASKQVHPISGKRILALIFFIDYQQNPFASPRLFEVGEIFWVVCCWDGGMLG